MPRIAAALLLLALLAPAAPADAARRDLTYKLAQDKLETLSFEVEHVVTTTFERMPPEAEPYDVEGLESSIASVKVQVAGSLERVVGRVFRDSSLGLVTRVVGLAGTVDRGQGAEAIAFDGLEGKSVSMRVLDSGELLASSGWQHLAGAGRGGDLVEPVLLQSILRLPFTVPEGEGLIPGSFRVRVPVDPLLNLDQTWTLQYGAGEVPKGCRRCVAISYSGTVTEAAEDQHPARPMKRAGEATVSGTILLSGKRGQLLEHAFSVAWTRNVTSHRENDTVRGAIAQTQTITGRIVAGDGQ